MARPVIAFSCFLVVSWFCCTVHQAGGTEVAWTMVVLPDTQNYHPWNGGLPKLTAMMEWIVDNKDSRNIQLVANVGDFTSYNQKEEWQRRAAHFSILNGEVPYIVVTGNHDYDPFASRFGREDPPDYDATMVNDYFALSDNPLNSITTERISGKLENSYSTFEALDGRKMLVLSLEWLPRTEVLDWANTIAGQAQFADHTAVLLTHAYLREWDSNPDGTDREGVRTPEGQVIWDALVSQHENFELVMNGHYLDWNDSNPYGRLTTARKSSLGIEGNTVHEIVFNAQQQPDGGNGYMRLMEFMDNGSTVQVRTYSPTLDKWLTNDRNEFQIELTPLFSDILAGDYNGDKMVDAADYTAWRDNVGALAGTLPNDVDGVTIGQLQYATWKANFGGTAGSTSQLLTPVPEPTTLLLLLMSLLLVGRRWR